MKACCFSLACSHLISRHHPETTLSQHIRRGLAQPSMAILGVGMHAIYMGFHMKRGSVYWECVCEREGVCVCVCGREGVCIGSVCGREGVCVCVCVEESERECV